MENILSNPLLQFIVGLAVLIVLHELGHFLAARLLKVEVEEFGIGFPPRILRLFQWRETEFTLNWIPLGGFVRPKGENDPGVEGGLAAASPWVRLGVLFAGPFMNILTGILLGVLLFYQSGDPVVDKVRVMRLIDNYPAQAAGLQEGDIILKINDAAINSIEKLREIVSASPDEALQFSVQRGEQTLVVTIVPIASETDGKGAIGIYMGNPTVPITFGAAVGRGLSATGSYVQNLVTLPARLASGEAAPEEGRPIGFKGMYDVYREIASPFWFFMILSISLGVFNLFPIPALDGGRILLTLPEILFRKRVPPKYETIIHAVGFALLIILMIYINIQDFVNPIILNATPTPK
jgi:regulator of sigma E protease